MKFDWKKYRSVMNSADNQLFFSKNNKWVTTWMTKKKSIINYMLNQYLIASSNSKLKPNCARIIIYGFNGNLIWYIGSWSDTIYLKTHDNSKHIQDCTFNCCGRTLLLESKRDVSSWYLWHCCYYDKVNTESSQKFVSTIYIHCYWGLRIKLIDYFLDLNLTRRVC